MITIQSSKIPGSPEPGIYRIEDILQKYKVQGCESTHKKKARDDKL